MVIIGLPQAAIAIVRNTLHRFAGGAIRGGHRTTAWSAEQRRKHAADIFNVIFPYLAPLAEKNGLEIGPGDNLDVCRLCLDNGSQRMYAIEKYATPATDDKRLILIPAQVEEMALPESVDFAYSNDVLEHVNDVPATMKAVFNSLRPGGRFVSSIDLRGHNVFSIPKRPLDFLTCPDWLWKLMFSHIVTTNRVRAHEFVQAAKEVGFVVVKFEALDMAEETYLKEIRLHMLHRYQELSDEDLRVLQLLLVLERPS